MLRFLWLLVNGRSILLLRVSTMDRRIGVVLLTMFLGAANNMIIAGTDRAFQHPSAQAGYLAVARHQRQRRASGETARKKRQLQHWRPSITATQPTKSAKVPAHHPLGWCAWVCASISHQHRRVSPCENEKCTSCRGGKYLYQYRYASFSFSFSFSLSCSSLPAVLRPVSQATLDTRLPSFHTPLPLALATFFGRKKRAEK